MPTWSAPPSALHHARLDAGCVGPVSCGVAEVSFATLNKQQRLCYPCDAMKAQTHGLAVIALAALGACPQFRGPADGDPGGGTSSLEPQGHDPPGHAQGAAPPSACRVCPAGVLRVELDTNAIRVGGQKLPLAPQASHRPSADPNALARCMEECAGSKLAISAGSEVNACFAGDVLRAASGTTFQTVAIEVDGRLVGTYQVTAARADLKLTSMHCGPRDNASTWIRDAARLRGITAPKSMELSVDYGCTLAEVLPTLRALSGKGLDLHCHFGPY